jgi:hypothetical protein
MTRRLLEGALATIIALALSVAPGRASGRIDTAHSERDRQHADACILGAVVIYTDPYIGGRMSHPQIVADIARMCAGAFTIYADDRRLDAPAARRLLRQVIEAGLRGQFHEDGGTEAMHGGQ